MSPLNSAVHSARFFAQATMSKLLHVFLTMVLGIAPFCVEAAGPSTATSPNKFVLEDVRIEGKIRRPQLVLIKADQRPAFEPMSLQSFGKMLNIVESVDQSVIESCPYRGAFSIEGKVLSPIVP